MQMISLIRQEAVKTLPYGAFRIIIILHFLLFITVILVPSRLNITVPGFSTDYLYQFPNVWEFIPWIASWFNILLALLIIILVCNEFSYQTFRQGVINGLSRFDLFAGKAFIITVIALYSTLLTFLLCLLFGLIFTDRLSFSGIFSHMYIVLVYFLQVIAYMVLALLISVLFRNTALSIVLFFLYRLVIEPLIRLPFPPETRQYFPVKIIANLTPTPEFLSISSGKEMDASVTDALNLRDMGILPHELPLFNNVLLTLVYVGLFVFIILWLLRKRNL
jgi:ABC-type transport system involved in multi-copper enzyme maturation permease subunit